MKRGLDIDRAPDLTPEVNAASTVLVVITIVLTIIAMRFQSPEKLADR